MKKEQLKEILEHAYLKYNNKRFIVDDPISIPHRFSKKEDIEIIGFLISIIAWGQRTSIVKSGLRLSTIFDYSPYSFIMEHTDSDLKKCLSFVHRTFNDSDLLVLIAFLKEIYTKNGSLEFAFSKHLSKKDTSIEKALNGFRHEFENSRAFLRRTSKHIAYPEAGSACKRLNMFLRWMVRKDNSGVDFGIWNSISPAQLICPLDVHVIREANQLGLINSDKSNWKTALSLTEELRKMDAKDPVKYDFALFGLGIEKKSQIPVFP